MEYRCNIEDPKFRPKLERLLDGLSTVYSLDVKSFINLWDSLPEPLYNVVSTVDANYYENTELEDLAEYCQEVFFWVVEEKKKAKSKVQKKKYKPFTLRNPEDLKQFEVFLDKMLELLDLSPGHFIEILPRCPLAYWDKIDDLRETSYKVKRDSAEYLRCLEKCKTISFAYSELSDIHSRINYIEENGNYKSAED